MGANDPDVTDMSDAGGTLASGPESRFVVDALDAVLAGAGDVGRRHLADGASATGWAAVLHRLDVAGRALSLDAGLRPADAPACAAEVADLAAGSGVRSLPAGVAEVLAAWSRGRGVPVPIDLLEGSIDVVPEQDRAEAACLALAWLVDRSGFPPQVVA